MERPFPTLRRTDSRERHMPKRTLLVFVLALVVSIPGSAGAQAKRLLAVDDLASVREVQDPERSPDGEWVAYVVSANDFVKDKRDSDVWMVKWDGSRRVRLTSSPDSESNPRWSPDGRYLAFTASRGDESDKKDGAQVWLLDRA